MVARCRVLLLERGLVFLVNNHESEFPERQENSRTGTKNHVIRLVGKLFLPYFHTLGIAVFGVIDAKPIAKHLAKTRHHLHGQGYFRQEIEHLPALINGFPNEMDIDFRLSR